MATDQQEQAETTEDAKRRAHYLTGLQWHAGAFVIINVFLWVMDIGLGQSGVQWAYWITGAWVFALAFHALAYVIDGRQVEQRKVREYVREAERERSSN